jgi:signal transduction histidine kinase/CheY-like chemotaxis protein
VQNLKRAARQAFRVLLHAIFTAAALLPAVAIPVPARAQDLPFLDDAYNRGLSPYGYRLDSYRWNHKDGLPDRYIYAFMQDRDGLLWLSSKSGLFTFDGFTFRPVEAVNEKPDGARIIRMLQDKAGNIWLVKYQDESFRMDVLHPATRTTTPLHSFLGKDEPIVIPEDSTAAFFYNLGSDIWLGTGRVVYRYDGAWQEVFRADAGKELGEWLPSKAGFWVIAGKELRLVDTCGEILGRFNWQDYRIGPVWVEQDLSLWAGILRPGQPGVERYLGFSTQGSNIALSTSRTPPKSAWHNDFFGPYLGKRLGRWLQYSSWQDSLYLGFQPVPLLFNISRLHPLADPISPRYFDREGGLWTVTNDGIIRLVVRPNLPFDRFLADGAPAVSTRGIALLRGRLIVNSYLGTRQVNLADGAATVFEAPFGEPGLALLSEGTDCWRAGHRQPLLRLASDGTWQRFPFEQQPEMVYTLLRSCGGQLLAGTDKGLFRLDERSGRMVHAGIREGTVGSLLQDGDRLWAGSSRGLLELDDAGNLLQAAFEPEAGSNFGFITHIHRDGEGMFWLSTHGGGLVRWNPATGEVRAFTTADGLSNDKLHAVYPDSSGNLWLPSDFGLMRFEKASGKVRTFFRSDGLAGDEFNLISHFRAPDGRLYLGGINGITSFQPDDFPGETLPYHSTLLQLQEAKTFNLRSGKFSRQPLPFARDQSLLVHPSDAFLELSLSALHFDRSDLSRFAWKLEGLQDEWVEQSEPNIRLSNLPYGHQRLLVRYGLKGNEWQGDPLVIPIMVLRPFYLDWPFALFLLLMLTGLAWLLSRWRTRQLTAANRSLEAEVERRTRQIAADRELIARQAEELRSLDEMKSRFFANVTHEFRTPLTLILGPIDRLLKLPGLGEKVEDGIRTIRKNAMRLQGLVEELLELSRLEAGKLRIEEQAVPLQSLLSRLLAAFLPNAEHRGLRLVLDFRCEPGLSLVLDVRKFEKVVNNLLDNAIKFTSRGGSITLSASCGPEFLQVQVEDTGQGIGEEDLPFVFDRYYQGGGVQARLQGGTGIGLALCREYARLLGGDITVQSALGEGSLFTLALPGKRASPSVAPVPSLPLAGERLGAAPPVPGALSSSKHTVLVVEDDRDMLEYIRSCLESEYQLLFADNGLYALQQLEQHVVDLVLSDLMMPEMDGFQLLEQVRQQHGDLPFIMLTARVETQVRLQALQLGVDDYLAKPFLEEELHARLRILIQRYETRIAWRKGQGGLSAATLPDQVEGEVFAFDTKWLEALEAVVKANMGNPDFSLLMMAEQMNVSKRTLQVKLKAYAGLTPHQYLLEARLLEARRMLEARAFERVSDVCFAVGLKTTQYFARLMKERFGKAPTDYR